MAAVLPDKNVTSLPPSSPASLLGGHLGQFLRDRVGFLTKQARLGDVSFYRLGPQPVFFVNDPDMIRDVFVVHADKFVKGRALQRSKVLLGNGLLTNEGASHLRQRRMIQPAFHRTRIAEYARSMVECGEQMSASWIDGETLDIDKEMMHLTLQIVGRTLFSSEVGGQVESVANAMNAMVESFNLLMLPYTHWLEKLPFGPSKRFRIARAALDEIIYGIINERRRSGEDKGDLLSMLLLAQDEDDGGTMTDEQVRDEALTLFLAGHETTANAMTWTWYLLSQNPQVEEKLHAELHAALDGREPGFDDIPTLKYTEAVLAESMRLYPPAWAIGRHALNEHKFGEFTAKAGTLILMSPYIMQRDPRFWDSPLEFRPERWESISVKEATARFIYFPFGGGIRRCIGESFAWTEGILLIASIARKWKLRLDPSQKIGLNPRITLRPKFGMKMKIESR
jgi:cytochrome P450